MTNEEENEVRGDENVRCKSLTIFVKDFLDPWLLAVHTKQIVVVSLLNSIGRDNEVNSEIDRHPYEIEHQWIHNKGCEVEVVVGCNI